MTGGRILADFLAGRKRVDALCRDLLRLIEEGENPVFDSWDDLQKENRAVMLESSSLLFSFLDHLHDMPEPDRSMLLSELLQDLDSVEEELFFQSTLELLKISNHMGTDRVPAIVVKKVVVDLTSLWRHVLSDTDKQVLRDYARSEKPLYFIKSKLTAVQVAQLLEEVTKETCPFKKAVPPYILVAMETVAKTSQLVGWISDASAGWMPSWPVSDAKKHKKAPSTKPLTAKPAQPETTKAPLRRGNSIFQVRAEPVPVGQSRSVSRDEPFISPPQPTRPALQRQKTVGIEMFPVLSGTVTQTGVRMGPPPKPKKRISFKIHNESAWHRLFLI